VRYGDVQVCLLLRGAIRNHHHKHYQKSVVVSLKCNVNVFSPVCVLKITIIKDVVTDTIEVRLLKTLVDFPNWLGSTSFPCTRDNVSDLYQTDDGVCTTSRS